MSRSSLGSVYATSPYGRTSRSRSGTPGDYDHPSNAERSCPQPVQIEPSAPEESDSDPLVNSDGDQSTDGEHRCRVDADWRERVDHQPRGNCGIDAAPRA